MQNPILERSSLTGSFWTLKAGKPDGCMFAGCAEGAAVYRKSPAWSPAQWTASRVTGVPGVNAVPPAGQASTTELDRYRHSSVSKS